MKACETRLKIRITKHCYRRQFWKREIELNQWLAETSSKRRDKLCIIAEILEVAKGGSLKTQIMYKANLSFAQLNEYLKFMLKINLIKKVDNRGKDSYIATEKGLNFLQRQGELTELLKDDKDEHSKNGAKTPPANLLRKN